MRSQFIFPFVSMLLVSYLRNLAKSKVMKLFHMFSSKSFIVLAFYTLICFESIFVGGSKRSTSFFCVMPF